MKFDPDLFQKEPVLGIIRGVPENSLEGVCNAARDAGLKFLESSAEYGSLVKAEVLARILHEVLNGFA